MTFEDTRAVLIDWRVARRRVKTISERMSETEKYIEQLCGGLDRDLIPHVYAQPIETAVERLEEQRKKFAEAIAFAFALEDKIANALGGLDRNEYDVIVGYYMDGKPNWRVAQDLNYSVEAIKVIKRRAIQKISEIL